MGEMGFRMANYDGGLALHPSPERKGRLVLKDSGEWELLFRRGRVHGGLRRFKLEASASGPGSCHVSLRDTQDPAVGAAFDLPYTPVSGFQTALVTYTPVVQSPSPAPNPGAGSAVTGWWVSVPPGTLSPFVRDGHSGTFTVNVDGLSWQGGAGSGFKLPWSGLRKVQVQTFRTQRGRKRSAFGIGPLGVGVVAATAIHNARAGKVSAVQKITLTDAKGVAWEFTTGLPRANVDVLFNPVIAAMKASNTPKAAPVAPAPNAIGVADELKKLVELRDSGVLTDEEFTAQKARLLG